MAFADFPSSERPRPARPAGTARTPGRGGAFGPTVVVLLILAGIVIALAEVWTDVLWFGQLGFLRVFWTEWLARAVLFLLGFVLMGGIVGLNTLFAYRARRAYVPVGAADRNLEQYRQQLAPLRRIIFFAIVGTTGLFMGASISAQWRAVLLWFNRVPFGETDPQFSLDVSFFVFTLPFLRLVLSALMWTLTTSLIAAAAVHYLYGAIVVTPRFSVARPARLQIAILAAVLAVLGAVSLWLDRYSLLLLEGDKFDGAGYAAVNASMPGKAILAGIALVVAILFIVAAVRGNWRLPVVGLALMVVSSIVVGGAYPAIVQRFQVDPNAVETESPFIQRNIDATLAAYGLQQIEKSRYSARTDTEAGQLREDSESTASIRLLDPTIVDQTFRQYQQNRQYYDFPDTLAVDRYTFDGESHDTVIAVRELNQDGLGTAQRTWVNDHTVYTHGYGVAAAYGNRTAADGQPQFFERGVPSTGALGEYEQRVYFGEDSPSYSIVGAPEGTEPWEFDYPDDNAENQYVSYTFQGDGGPSVGSFFNKVLYAIKFQSFNVLFSDRVTSESQILYDRDPRQRVAEVAPFLTLDGRTYPAVVDSDDDPDTPKDLLWIVDGYTTSNDYPYSAREALEDATLTSLGAQAQMLTPVNEVNYIRNSVKATVNAYDGSVTLYEWDSEDPVLRAWKGVFPNIVTPTSAISGDLMTHLRYPEDLFKVQRELLTRYHVDDAASFYSGNDFWANPSDPTAGEAVPQPPYYMTLKMPRAERATFSLTSSFIPGGQSGRQILTGFLAVDADPGNEAGVIAESYGTIRLLELPRDLTVPGPGQVQNLFNANPTVSQQLNLLEQNASQVLRGNLLTLPVGGGLLYVQPVYTQSARGTQVPLLHRVLVSFGDEIGFAPTLSEALDQVFEGDSGAATADGGTVEPGDGGGEPVETTAEEDLRAALRAAAQAMRDADAALAEGNWTAYGAAQARLDAALQDAIDAEARISGESPVDAPAIPETPEEGIAPTAEPTP